MGCGFRSSPALILGGFLSVLEAIPPDQEDGRLMSPNNHHIRVWMPGGFIEQSWGKARRPSENVICLVPISPNGKPRQGDVFISSFLPPTGIQDPEQRHFNGQAEGRSPLRQAVMCDYNNKSNGKQVQEAVPTRKVRIAFSLRYPDLIPGNSFLLHPPAMPSPCSPGYRSSLLP